MLVKFLEESVMELGNSNSQTVKSTRAFGNIIPKVAKVSTSTKTKPPTMVNGLMTRKRATASPVGPTESSMRVSMKMASCTEKGSWNMQMGQCLRGIFTSIESKVLAAISPEMGLSMLGIG